MSGFLDRTPLIALSVCHGEKGTTIDVPGHWWEGTTASDQTLIFKCSVSAAGGHYPPAAQRGV
jgi:hypothetical protein